MAQVLVVDSAQQIRDLLKTILERAGHTVTLAETSAEASALYLHHKFDVVVVDIISQDEASINALMDMRRDFPRSRIISICGAPIPGGYSSEPEKLAVGLGADETIGKPFKLDDFLTMVEKPVLVYQINLRRRQVEKR